MIKNISLNDVTNMHSHCRNRCTMEGVCVSINIGVSKDRVLCQLSDSDHIQHSGDLTPLEGFAYSGTKVINSYCYQSSTRVVNFRIEMN